MGHLYLVTGGAGFIRYHLVDELTLAREPLSLGPSAGFEDGIGRMAALLAEGSRS